MYRYTRILTGVIAMSAGIALSAQAYAASHGQTSESEGLTAQNFISTGLVIPNMNAARGRQIFASKGCVVCHSINGIGGEDAPPLDASTMKTPMNPFDFTASMWRGAEAMVALQREELGDSIELTGQDMADIIAFVHDGAEQKNFSDSDLPPRIKDLMKHGGDEEQEDDDEHESDKRK
tara:strand:+ start:1975 stop:2508 length:534 start_codon:yes stop_codon:yes gene_type:complete